MPVCGIVVAVGCESPEALVANAVPGILHRGDITDPIISPAPGAAMCTRRLRIVDPANGVQPQSSFDGGLVVAFNGEIYNYVALREELEGLGVPFRTSSDTEVLANALRVWGAGALKRLNGMYAFVALEIDTGEFIAARDPFGVKPLYLINVGGGYLFCSEIHPLLDAAPTGDVLLLPPGHLLMKGVFAPFQSAIAAASDPIETNPSPEALDRLLAKAVEIRVPKDLPCATLFSGGIDSTLVAHYARRIQPNAPGYFLGGEGAPDLPYALQYADQTGYDLRVVPFDLGEDRGLGLMKQLIRAVESFEPEVVRSSVCSYLISRRVHEDGYRVALCGEGADELFAGYIPLELAFASSDELGRSVQEQTLSGMHRSSLQRIDRCGMRFQTEVREPFLDPSVVNYTKSLSASDFVDPSGGRPMGKTPLRQLYDLYPGQLPTAIRDRTKVPFNEGAGFDESQTRSPWRTLAEDHISDRDFADGVKEFARFEIATKEELLYISTLESSLNIWRVPHLQGRSRLSVPREFALSDGLKEFIV